MAMFEVAAQGAIQQLNRYRPPESCPITLNEKARRFAGFVIVRSEKLKSEVLFIYLKFHASVR